MVVVGPVVRGMLSKRGILRVSGRVAIDARERGDLKWPQSKMGMRIK